MKTKLILDVYKTEYAQLNYLVTGRVGDVASNSVDVYIVDGSGNPYSLTNLDIFYECTKPDNTVIRDSTGVKMIDAANGHFEYTFPKETFGAPGRSKRSFFAIEKQGVIRATTQDFIVVSLSNALDGNVQSEQYISDLERMIGQANDLIKHIKDLEQQAGGLVDKELATIRSKTDAFLKDVKDNADKVSSGIQTNLSSLQKQADDLQKKVDTMDVVKRSGDTMLGSLTFTTEISNILKKVGRKSWAINHPDTDSMALVPSKTIDGIDWDFTNGVYFDPRGKIYLGGSEVATFNTVKQKHQLTNDDGTNIGLVTGTDLNAILNTGFYKGYGLLNSPTQIPDAWMFIEVQKHIDKWVLQRATIFTSQTAQETYERILFNGVWQPWKKTVTNKGWGNWETNGQDLLVWGKRAMVGLPTTDKDTLNINHNGDFKNGVAIAGIVKVDNLQIKGKDLTPSNASVWYSSEKTTFNKGDTAIPHNAVPRWGFNKQVTHNGTGTFTFNETGIYNISVFLTLGAISANSEQIVLASIYNTSGQFVESHEIVGGSVPNDYQWKRLNGSLTWIFSKGEQIKLMLRNSSDNAIQRQYSRVSISRVSTGVDEQQA